MPYDRFDNPFDWPNFGLVDDVRSAMIAAARGERPMALATLFAVDGGAPRAPGAQMLFVDGPAAGFLSGGCIEADVALHAQEVIQTGRSRILTYGKGGPIDLTLPCGSSIKILLEPVAADDQALARLRYFTATRRPAIWISDGDSRTCVAEDEDLGPSQALRPMLLSGDAECAALDDPFVLARRHTPAIRVVVIGGEPPALALTQLAAHVGLETILVRPRGPASPPPEPAAYLRLEPQEALAVLLPDPWTAVAILTHDLDDQHAALVAALSADAGYVGAIGSRKRIGARNLRLSTAGLDQDRIGRLHAPIGLPIGGKSPWRIAIATLAEIMASIG